MFDKFCSLVKNHTLLIIVTIFLLLIITFFHQILTPFVIAIIVVYLIDPIVSWMNRIHIKKFRISRGFAVIVAYLMFLAATTGICLAFIPTLTDEITAASDAVPKYFMRVKNEDIPKLSEHVDDIIFKLSRRNTRDIARSIKIARAQAEKALENAIGDVEQLTLPEIDTSGASPLLVNTNRQTPEIHNASENPDTARPIFTLKETSQGVFEFYPGSQEIQIVPDDNGALTIKTVKKNIKPATQNSFNLERELNNAITQFLESSTQYAGSALSFLQSAITVIINTFIDFILVFMLAAFIAIDSPKLHQSIRALFENKDGKADAFDDYKNRLMRGLAGVVRGQLIICLINGTLTAIGLYLCGIKFSLLLGLIAGIFTIVPIFGTIISTIPAVLLGLAQGPMDALLVLAIICGVHLLDTNFWTPRIVGSSSNLHPVIIIFALLAGQFAAGILGLILAVPVASMIHTTFQFFIERNKNKSAENLSNNAENSSMHKNQEENSLQST